MHDPTPRTSTHRGIRANSDPLHTAQQAHHDLELAAAMARHPAGRRRPFVRPEDKQPPQRINPLGDPSDYERPSTATTAAAIALTVGAGLLLGTAIYALFAGWEGPL